MMPLYRIQSRNDFIALRNYDYLVVGFLTPFSDGGVRIIIFNFNSTKNKINSKIGFSALIQDNFLIRNLYSVILLRFSLI